MRLSHRSLFLICIFILGFTACTSPTPTQPVVQPTAKIPTAIVATPTTFALQATSTPGISGPPSVPAAPNLSLIQGRVVSITQQNSNVVLRIKIVSSEPKPGFLDFGTRVVGQEIDAFWMDKDKQAYSTDQVISGELSYQGDERGGNYSIINVHIP